MNTVLTVVVRVMIPVTVVVRVMTPVTVVVMVMTLCLCTDGPT